MKGSVLVSDVKSISMLSFIIWARESNLFCKELILISATITQPVITCSNLTIETLEQGVKYVQS